MALPHPIASLSIDLDNQWSYMKVHGDAGWERFPSYLDTLVPRVLEFLSNHDLKITFFIVGQDAALEKNHAALRMISCAGHEVGNHSFSHEPWFHLYDRGRVESEIARTEDCLFHVTGQRPVGYRAPGFSLSTTTLEVLTQRGYSYDASTLPTFIGPLARLYYLFHSKLEREERRNRKHLFGSFSEGMRPIRPYRWGNRYGIVEIPVTTMPLLRLPIHLSYLLYLSCFSTRAALLYFQTALNLCKLLSIPPSLLLHPLDFLGADDEIGLEFFPAMRLVRNHKMQFLSEVIRMFRDGFRVVPVKELVRTVRGDLDTAVDCRPCSARSLSRSL